MNNKRCIKLLLSCFLFGERSEIKGEDFADQAICVSAVLVVGTDANEAVCVRVELVLERDNDDVHAALVVSALGDVGGHFANVGVVESSVDLVLLLSNITL